MLFGLAVLLILAAALYVPGYFMESLVHNRNLQEPRRYAMLARARIDPSSNDWAYQQALLDRWWEDNAKELKLPDSKPRLILLRPTFGFESGGLGRLRWLRWSSGPLSRPIVKLVKCVQPPMSVRLIQGVYGRLPEEIRQRFNHAGRKTLSQIIQSGGVIRPVLDDFQKECIRQMRAKESLNEMSANPDSDHPNTYRFVLAVRESEVGSARRSLVGIIDVENTSRDTAVELLWTRVILVVAGVMAGFLAILVFYLISQKLILAPVRELKVLVERIAGGDLSARSDITTGDEYEELSDAFNDMLGELERARDELETINRSLDTRLGELAETNVALYESNRLKSEFLANVSHELRTPLTTIIGFADLLRDVAHTDGDVDTKRITRFAYNILTSGRLLLDIINDLLDLAKIEAGKIELHRVPFS
ncbi:MAG: sensor histidine kinase, partial [Planctomycetota bacterium]